MMCYRTAVIAALLIFVSRLLVDGRADTIKERLSPKRKTDPEGTSGWMVSGPYVRMLSGTGCWLFGATFN